MQAALDKQSISPPQHRPVLQGSVDKALTAMLGPALQKALPACFEAVFQKSIIPAFEAACQTMFKEVRHAAKHLSPISES